MIYHLEGNPMVSQKIPTSLHVFFGRVSTRLALGTQSTVFHKYIILSTINLPSQQKGLVFGGFKGRRRSESRARFRLGTFRQCVCHQTATRVYFFLCKGEQPHRF